MPNESKFGFILSGWVREIGENGRVVKNLRQNELVGDMAIIDPRGSRRNTLKTEEETGIIECKVTECKDGGSPSFVVNFTSVSPEAEAFLKSRLEADKQDKEHHTE